MVPRIGPMELLVVLVLALPVMAVVAQVGMHVQAPASRVQHGSPHHWVLPSQQMTEGCQRSSPQLVTFSGSPRGAFATQTGG